MQELEKQKSELEVNLKELKANREASTFRLNSINKEIKEKVGLHNGLVASLGSIKNEYKNKIQMFNKLKILVKEYKKSQKEALEKEYKKEIERCITQINAISFEVKLRVFKSFDELKSIQTSLFPTLDKKKDDLFNVQRIILKKSIYSQIKSCIREQNRLADLIFYLNFIIKYEIYFQEDTFIQFLAKMVDKEFEYHFLSDKETNRLDKPEWFFDFLIKKYNGLEPILKIYSECRIKLELPEKNIEALIQQSKNLIIAKLTEITKIETSQKRNLVLHFATKFYEFKKEINETYLIDFTIDEVKHTLFLTQSEYVASEMSRIHDLRYVQWFSEYKMLCKDSMLYINKYGGIDTEFNLKGIIKMIISHTKLFIDNLRFINRLEVQAICFVFNELDGLKNFILEQENEMVLFGLSNEESDIGSSITKLTMLNADIFKLIKKLAVGDVQDTFQKVICFRYATNEVKRTVIVQTNRIIEDYKICIYSDLIEKKIQHYIDQLLVEELLLKNKFTPDEYLEFRGFFRGLKGVFSNSTWNSDDACECISAIFEDRVVNSQLFKKVKLVYEN
ncbi:RAD50-interacting protein 1 [Glugoides intestinalis]